MSSSCCFCGKGHPGINCPTIYIDHFSRPATDKGTPTPSMKKSYIPLKRKVGLNPHSSQSYKQEVDLRVKNWISNATKLCDPFWFCNYQKKEEEDHTDPFLKAVQHQISEIVEQLCFEKKLEEKKEADAYEREEIEEYNREQKIKAKREAERKSLQESMTPEEWDAFLQKEEDEYDPCYDSDY
jgi:hypothetical protein